MRIVFILNELQPGGAEIHTFQLASILSSSGDLCTIVGLKGSPDKSLISAGVPVEVYDGNHLYSIATMRRLASTIRRQRPDVIVAINQRPLWFGVIARRLAASAAKLVSIFHTSYLLRQKDQVLHPLYRRLFTRADALIYVSESQRKLWEGRGYHPQCATVIHNGIDLDRFSTRFMGEWRERARARMGFGQLDYVIGMCARFAPEKNHNQLLEAIQLLRSRGIPARALLIGGGATRSAVEAYARRIGLREHVMFAGKQEDVRPYISACDVGVLCSLGETLPLAPLEMMALGIPVVMSNVGGAPEIIRQGETGFVFQVGDTEAMAGFLEELFDAGRRKLLGGAAAKWVAERFAMGRMVESYQQFFNQLLLSQQCIHSAATRNK